MSKKESKLKMKNLFRGFRKSTTDLSEWSKNDEKLMKAAEARDAAKMDTLLTKKSLNPTKLGPKGLSVFHVACSLGLTNIVQLLISHGAEVNVLSIQGNTSVQLAARDGWPQVLEKLVEAGGVIDHKDGMSLTALHHACVRGQVQCVQVLLRAGADPNSQDKTGKPPLFYAAFSGDLPVCKELIDRGANVNAHDLQQLTPLMAAAKKGNADVCEFLLKKGADRNFTDNQGHDALSYGLDAGFDNLREVFNRAPARASWDVHQNEAVGGAEGGVKASAPVAQPVVPAVEVQEPVEHEPTNKEDMVAKFVPERTPEPVHKKTKPVATESAEVIQILAVSRTKEDTDEETLAERAASPPQSVIDQRTLEAFKELEEENEHMNEDLKNLTTQHKRLQEAYDALKKNLSEKAPPPVDVEEVQELEDELTTLKTQLTEEQDKNVRLIDKMKKLKKKGTGGKGDGKGQEEDEDSWNDSDEELFESSTLKRKKNMVVDHKPQTLLLLQNQVSQLRQENKMLRERVQDKTGSISSLASLDDASDVDRLKLETDRLRRRLDEMEQEKITLQLQMQDSGVFPEEYKQNVMVLEQENTQLHDEVKQLRTEINVLKHSTDRTLLSDSSKHMEDGSEVKLNGEETFVNIKGPAANETETEMAEIGKENEALRTENSLLTEELESLRDTYNKLVIAGDNLQDMYDQLVLEKEQVHEDLEQIVKAKQELAKEHEYLLTDGNAMHDDIERLVQEVEKLHGKNEDLVKDKEELEHKLTILNQSSSKASDFARVSEERDKLQEMVSEYEKMSIELKQNHDLVLEEVQSLQETLQRVEFERDQLQQEFDSLQDEFENVQGSQEGLQQDYSQLEQDYTDLLSDKEKLEQEFMEVQTASVNVEQHNPALTEEVDKLSQENNVLGMEKEQLEMTVKELSKSIALLQEELTSMKDALQMNGVKEDSNEISLNHQADTTGEAPLKSLTDKDSLDKADVDGAVEKDRRIRSLQIQISRLQQQLAESDGHYREVISTYRTHLLSAVQGHLDPDVKKALFSIVELRSMEQFC